jgi:CubicO group peptidase (beta-lactamase class C family)
LAAMRSEKSPTMRDKLVGGAVAAITFIVACSSKGAVPFAPAPFSADAAPRNAEPCAKRISIAGMGTDARLDNLVAAFMCKYGVPNAQLAASSNKKTVFSHAYTYQGKAISIVTTGTLMRLASNTKPWTGAAIYTLVQANKIHLDTRVFDYLGLTTPEPPTAYVNPLVYTITVKDMLDHKAGWSNDPSFAMRDTALDLGLTHHIDQDQYVRAQLPVPLAHDPGTKYKYCNFCYDVLGMVVAKASGMSFAEYLDHAISSPSGGGEIAVSPTIDRLPNEVAEYYSTKRGLSAYYPTLQTKVPAPYGGDGGVLEVAQGDGGMAASAQTELAFTNHYTLNDGYGPPPPPGKAASFEGGIAGTATWAEQLPNCTNFAFDVNSDEFPTDNTFGNYQARIASYLEKTYHC